MRRFLHDPLLTFAALTRAAAMQRLRSSILYIELTVSVALQSSKASRPQVDRSGRLQLSFKGS